MYLKKRVFLKITKNFNCLLHKRSSRDFLRRVVGRIVLVLQPTFYVLSCSLLKGFSKVEGLITLLERILR